MNEIAKANRVAPTDRIEGITDIPMYPGASGLGDEEAAAVARVMDSRALFRYYGLSEPQEVAQYEQEWSGRIGTRHALAVNSGSSALLCALVAAGVGHGDEVLIPAYTWIATANMVLQTGATPVLVEIDDSLTMDPTDAERRLTSRTKAVLPVHMRGSACEMEQLGQLARTAGLALIEDACQAAGGSYRGVPLGRLGDAGVFSTQYAKLVTSGEGGIMVTDDADLYRRALDVHDPANAMRRGEAPAAYPGFNFRCSELQAAVGRIQLHRLNDLVDRLRANAAMLDSLLGDIRLARRVSRDPVGDVPLALVWYEETPDVAAAIVNELQQVGVPATLLFHPGHPDLHVYCFWRPMQEAMARAGIPFQEFTTTLDWLGRAIHIDMNPSYTDLDFEFMALAIRKAVQAPRR